MKVADSEKRGKLYAKCEHKLCVLSCTNGKFCAIVTDAE